MTRQTVRQTDAHGERDKNRRTERERERGWRGGGGGADKDREACLTVTSTKRSVRLNNSSTTITPRGMQALSRRSVRCVCKDKGLLL